MVAIARRSPVVLFGAFLLAPFLHAFPASGGEDKCVHLTGSGGPSQSSSSTPTLQSKRTAGTGGGGPLAAGICAVDNARLNTALPLKTNADFVPITGDDGLGFYNVYGVKASSTGGVGGNVGIFLFELTGGEVLVFGSGYGNITGANLFDAAYDMERVDQVIRFCMGKDPATTPLRLLAPHGHGDHINPACNRELERLGYRIVDIAFHPGDFVLINSMAWTTADRALFRILPQGTTCLEELASYTSPLGKLWVYHRPGHTDGSIDLVIDVKNDVTNRFVVRGSQSSSPCMALSGQREAVDAHGNAELFSVRPSLNDVAPLGGTALGGTAITLTGSNFGAAGAGAHRVLIGDAPATEVLVTSDTSLTCKTPPGPPGELVDVAVVNNNGKAVYAGTYFYNPLPTLTSISPTTGDWRGGTVVQVRGTGFMLSAGVNDVYFGGIKGTSVSVKSDSLLTCKTPAGTPGRSVTVLLRNPNGEAKIDNAFRYSSDLLITSVEPSHASALGGTIVLLSGTAFTGSGSTPTVTFGGVATGLVTLLSDTTVLAVVPPGAPGTTASIVLTNSVGSATFPGFRYHAFPRLTSLAPISGRDQGATTVTLSGTGFLVDDAGTNNVRFGGAPAQQVTVLSDGSLRCLTPPGTRGTSVNVTISNQNGTAVLPLAFTYSGPLEVSALQPGSGSSLGGTLVTLTGNGFVDGPAGTNTVRFGGVLATQIVAVDDRTLTCRTPAGTPLTTVDVDLANNNGTLTLPGAFRYHAKPTIATIAPNHGNATTSTPVSLTGTGFLADQAGVNVITVGGVAATSVQVLNDTTLVCSFPPGPAGATVNVVLTNQNGSTTLAGGFRYHGAPTLTSIAPSDGAASQQLRVTLTGTGFLNDSAGTPTITFGGLAASSVSVSSDTSVKCNAPVGPAGQTVDVVLTNARGSATLPRAYRFHATPRLTSMTPAAGTSQGGTTITLTGAGFLVDGAGVNVVSFGGAFASNVVVVNDTTLRCTNPPGVLDAVVDVVISNTNGTSTLARGFSYSISPPVVAAVTPASGPAQAPGSVQITGMGFLASGAGTNSVRFGSLTSGIVGVVDDTRLSCQVPPGTPGTTVDVVVSNANGTNQLARAFRYHALPVLSSLSPATGGAAGGTTVQLTGSGFQVDSPGTNTVTFGGFPAQNVTVVSNTTLSCTVPAGSSGTTVDVRVSNANGQTSTRPFSYYARPTLLGSTPASGSPTGGTRVSLRGTGFVNNDAGPNAVRFGQRAAANVVAVSDTELSCIAPRGDVGPADVVVSNANGWATLVGGFFYGKLAPTLTGLQPPSGPARGTNVVTLKGRGFTGSGLNSVRFGAVLATGVVTLDDETVQCAVPAGKSGTSVDVELVNTTGASVLVNGYRYHMPPTLAAISPTQGKALQETRVTLTGTGFAKDSAGPTEVLFGGIRARDVLVLDDTRVTCKTMGGGPGAVMDVTLRNANGSATLNDAYRVIGGPPSIASMTPASGPFTGGTRVDFVGRGFSAGPVRVTFGDQEALAVEVSGDTLVSCVTPPGTIGEHVTVMLSNKNGSTAMVGGFAYEGIRPVLTGIVPDHGAATGGLRVTLSGSAFRAFGVTTTRVTFAGVPATNVAVLGDTSVSCTVPPGSAGTSSDVELRNENGRATLVQGFRYHAAPTLSALAPPHGRPEGGTLVTLTGSGFSVDGPGTNLVLFGNVAALNVSVVSDTVLACTTPPGTLGTTVDVTVTNLNGSVVLTNGFSYRIPSQITSVSPARGSTDGGTALTITGSGFQANAAGVNRVTVKGATALDVVTLGDTTITCRTAPVAAGGLADVVVTNDNGSATAAGAFRYVAPPLLAALAPAHGPAAGGTRVTLTGSGFLELGAGAHQVLFGGVAASAVTVVSDTTITCTTPPGTRAARVDVLVQNGNGATKLTAGFRYHEGPVLTQSTPDHGPSGGSTVTLTGRGFLLDDAGTNTVRFGGVAATQVVVVDDTRLSCRAPAGVAGASVDVSVSNANGSTTLGAGYRYHREPTLSALAPIRGPAAGGTSLTLTGTGFQVDSPGATQVIVGGFGAASVVVLNDTTLTCTTPAGNPDQRANVTVSNANGQATLVDGFRYNPAPTLTALLPASGSALGGTTVTLTGSGFALGSPGPSSVRFGGVPATSINVQSDTSLTCVTPPGTQGASVDVSVTNLSGTTTLVAGYRFSTVPTLTSLAPDHGTALGGTQVTLMGTGFADAGAGSTQVSFGGVPATSISVQSDTSLTCVTPPGTPGARVDVSVTNPSGTATLVAGYRYTTVPTLTSLAPDHGTALGGTGVTLTGTGFADAGAGSTQVSFGGVLATNISVQSDTSLTCVTPPGTSGARVDVSVSNANGSTTLGAGYRYHNEPTVSALAPTRGPAAGGTSLTLTGTGFQVDSPGATQVFLGVFGASNVVVLNDTTLTCTTPAGNPDQRANVTVANANGQATLVDGFRYNPAPTLTSLLPASGSALGGTTVTLTGSGFALGSPGPNSVRFGGVLATSISVQSDTSITCVTPPGTQGASVDVSVTNLNGTTTLVAGYRYTTVPMLTSLAPDHGTALGGTGVTLTGTGFADAGAGSTQVSFGGVLATSISVQSDTSITCVTPPGASGARVNVSVSNANGSTTLSAGYRYHRRPTFSAVAPIRGPAAGGTSLTITGTGFQVDSPGATQVILGVSQASNVVVVNNTTLTCTTPAGTPDQRVNVTVANANGQATLVDGFRYNPAPKLTSLLPASGSALGGTTVTLTGSGFALGSPGPNSVRFGGVLATSISVQSDTSLTCVTPPGTQGASVDVSVTNLNGTATLVAGYRYTRMPTLTSLAPDHGTALGGTGVTLTGSAFADAAAGATQVSFGGIAATAVTVLDDQHVSCSAPPGMGGSTRAVVVSNQNGAANLTGAFRYHALPRVQGVMPTHGSSSASTSVTLAGAGFLIDGAGANTVRFGSVPALNVVVVDDTTLTCDVAPQTPGSVVDVRVGNLNGEGLLAVAFTFDASSAPTIASISPASGTAAGGGTLTLTGTGFQANGAGLNTITFAGVAATSVTVLGDTSLTCKVPSGAAGTLADVRVSNANGAALLTAGYRYHALPRVQGVLPTHGSSSANTSVTLAGAGFLNDGAGANTVRFGSVAALNVVVVDDGTLTCEVEPQTPGSVVDLRVGNLNGEDVRTGAFRFDDSAAPTIASISPASGPAAGGDTLTFMGTGFQANAAGLNTITFAGVAATNVTVLGDTSLTCKVPSGAAGTLADVRLSNANGDALLTAGYRYHGLPTITSLSPADGTAAGGTLVTVRGSGFQNDAAGTVVVKFADRLATSVGVFEDGRLTCRAPSGTAGTSVTITLTTANGETQLVNGYDYHPKPTLTAVTPADGPASGGNRVTLTGTGFIANGASQNAVKFGGIAATNILVQNDRAIECTVPPGTSGLSVSVSVTNVNGSASLANGYRYHARPTLTNLSPRTGPLTGGTTVTLAGTGFQVDSPGTNRVTFGGLPATAVSVQSDIRLTCVTPAGAATATVDVVLSNDNGANSLLNAFTYEGVPIVAAALPNKGTTQGSTSVTVTGTGFLPDTTVVFGSQAALSVVVVDESTIECLTPPTTGSAWVDVKVSSSKGEASLPQGYLYVAPPTLTAVVPSSGTPLGGTMVVLSGSGFLDNAAGENSVTFAGRPASNVSVLDDQHLACEVPGGTVLTDADVVVANDNGTASLPDGFRWQFPLATDLNRDGRGDLILSSPGDDRAASDAGAVRVFFGSSLPAADRRSSGADLLVLPERVATSFGLPVTSGDLDGDGDAELLIGAPLDDAVRPDAGAVYVFEGPHAASASALSLVDASTQRMGSFDGQRFGTALSLRDVDRDGVLDLLVGATGGTGAVHLYLGGAGGLDPLAARVVTGATAGDSFGYGLATGDLDGDGWMELLVGAPNSLGASTGPSSRPGAVRVFRGGPTLFDSTPWLTFSGLRDGESFGSELVASDLTGDGYEDLVVGSPWASRSGSKSGAAFVFSGGAALVSKDSSGAQAILSAEGPGDLFGYALATGDVNGDGMTDLLAGAPGQSKSGRAYLFLGRQGFADRGAAEADIVLQAEAGTQGDFGSKVALVDVDGNGLADMVVTAPRLDSSGADVGRVYVFRASTNPTRHGENDDATMTGSSAGEELGRSTTGDH